MRWWTLIGSLFIAAQFAYGSEILDPTPWDGYLCDDDQPSAELRLLRPPHFENYFSMSASATSKKTTQKTSTTNTSGSSKKYVAKKIQSKRKINLKSTTVKKPKKPTALQRKRAIYRNCLQGCKQQCTSECSQLCSTLKGKQKLICQSTCSKSCWGDCRFKCRRRFQRLFITPSLGISHISYSETGRADMKEIAVTAKLSMRYAISKKWDAGMSAYFTALPISSSIPQSVRFLGINFRGGYVLPFVKRPWRMAVLGGIYYTTMMVQGNSFGFKNMAGPQLFPVIQRTFKKSSIMGYAKLSPVTSNLAPLSLDNREIAIGLGYGLLLKNAHPLMITLDIASLQLVFPATTTGGTSTDTSSNSISIGAGYGL